MSYSIYGQNTKILNARDGLPQSFVSGLVQDREGEIWVSTRNGLARFDGKKFTRFKHEPGKRSSIAANTIISMQKDGESNVWIEYESSAIDKISLLTGEITHYPYFTLPSQMVRKGWFITSGKQLVAILRTGGIQMHKISKTTLSMVSYESLGGKMAKGFCEDSKGRLWILTESGITRLTKSGNLDKFFPSPQTMVFPVQTTSDINIIDLHERLNGDLIWGDSKNIYVFNPVRQHYQIVPLPVQSSTGILYIERNPADSTDYFECEGAIYCLNELQIKEIYNTKGIKKGGVRAFILDKSGMLWIGTNSKGILQVDLMNNFNARNYSEDFLSDILQSEFGLTLKSFNWNEKDTDFSLPGYHLRSRYDSRGRLWLALKRTVCYYETGKGVVKLPQAPQIPYSEGPIPIKGITFLGQDIPLVGYSNGDLFYYHIKNGWQPYLQGLRKSSGLKILVQDIFADKANIWMTTAEHGLICINRTTKKIKRIAVAGTSSDKNHLLGIEQIPTRANDLWIASYSGLIRFDKTNRIAHLFNQKQGLPDNTVYSVIADNTGTLWVTTNNGIGQFNTRDYRYRTFTAADGLPENEFNRFHHLKLPNGDIALGTTLGMVKFSPGGISDFAQSPQVRLTKIKIDNHSKYKEDQFHNPVNRIGKLYIRYGQSLAIEFDAIQYNNPENVSYRYIMEGYDKIWAMPGQNNSAYYERLLPGDYIFKVDSRVNNLKWNTDKELHITVQPLWYQSWYAYVLYWCLGIGFAVLAICKRLRRFAVDRKIEVKGQGVAYLNVWKRGSTLSANSTLQVPNVLKPLQSSPVDMYFNSTIWLALSSLTTGNIRQILNIDYQFEEPIQPSDSYGGFAKLLLFESGNGLHRDLSFRLGDKFKIFTVTDSVDVLSLTLQIAPDIIIIDNSGPLNSDLTFFLPIKTNLHAKNIPIILCKNENLCHSIVEEEMADEYFDEPIDVLELESSIKKLLAASGQTNELTKPLQHISTADVLHNQNRPKKEFLQNVCDIIDQHMEDESFSTDKLASIMHIGRTTLHRKIKNFTGMATAEFILGYRLQCAAILLESGFTVSECAYKTGFASPAYFTKRFKLLYAMTPTQFIAAKHQK